MARALAFIDLLISSVTLINYLSSLFSLIGIVTGQAAKIFPISKPFANVAKTWGGIEKLSLVRRAALALAVRASLFRKGIDVKLESKSTPNIFISWVGDMRLEPILIWHTCFGDTSS